MLASCSNPSLERLTGATTNPDASTEVADTDAEATAQPVTSDETPAASEPEPVPTAVFATDEDQNAEESDTESLSPAPTGAFLTARQGAGQAVTGPAWIIPVYDEPDGTPRTLLYEYPDTTTRPYPLTNPSFFGNPLVLRVVDGVLGDEWIQVQAPIRPGNQTVWVRGEDFEFSTTEVRLEVDLADTTARVYDGDERIFSTRVGHGKIDQPTPLGLSYVSEVITQPLGSGGPFVFNLSLFSSVVRDVGGALPAITLHGTSERDDLGKRVTGGTMRAPADAISSIADTVKPGSLVLIFDSSDPETDRDAIMAAAAQAASTAAP